MRRSRLITSCAGMAAFAEDALLVCAIAMAIAITQTTAKPKTRVALCMIFLLLARPAALQPWKRQSDQRDGGGDHQRATVDASGFHAQRVHEALVFDGFFALIHVTQTTGRQCNASFLACLKESKTGKP